MRGEIADEFREGVTYQFPIDGEMISFTVAAFWWNEGKKRWVVDKSTNFGSYEYISDVLIKSENGTYALQHYGGDWNRSYYYLIDDIGEFVRKFSQWALEFPDAFAKYLPERVA